MHVASAILFGTRIFFVLGIRFSSIVLGGEIAQGVCAKFVAWEQDENPQIATLSRVNLSSTHVSKTTSRGRKDRLEADARLQYAGASSR